MFFLAIWKLFLQKRRGKYLSQLFPHIIIITAGFIRTPSISGSDSVDINNGV